MNVKQIWGMAAGFFLVYILITVTNRPAAPDRAQPSATPPQQAASGAQSPDPDQRTRYVEAPLSPTPSPQPTASDFATPGDPTTPSDPASPREATSTEAFASEASSVSEPSPVPLATP